MKRAWLFSLILACTPEGRPPVQGGGGGGGQADAGTQGGGSCDAAVRGHHDGGSALSGVDGGVSRDPMCPASASFLTSVSGKVVDSMGRGVANAAAQVCLRLAPSESLVCLRPLEANASGDYVVPVPDTARCTKAATLRALLPMGNYSTAYCHIELPAGGQDILSRTVTLFPTTRVSNLPPLGDEQMTRVVRFADGLEMDFKPFDFFAEYPELAAAKVDPAAGGLCFLEGKVAPDLLYAFSPEGAVDGAGFKTRIPNSLGWPAGTVADVYILGGLGCRTPGGQEIPEAEWRAIGTATVDAAGTHLVTADGAGVTCLTMLGVKRRC